MVRGAKDNVEFSKVYLEVWIKAMRNDKNLRMAWNQTKKWTDSHMREILYPLAKRLGYYDMKCEKSSSDCLANCKNDKNICYEYYVQQEYYKVDFIMSDWHNLSHWVLDYAIEHENAQYKADGKIIYKGWFDEFAKLLPLKCRKSRVIIGYNKSKNIDVNIENCKQLLQWHDTEIGEQNSIADSPILLIIFCLDGELPIIIEEFYRDNGQWINRDITQSVCGQERLDLQIREIYKAIAEEV